MKRLTTAALAFALAALSMLSFSSQASAGSLLPAINSESLLSTALNPCDQTGITQRFLAWGDPRYYVPAPGGSFESGTAGWTLGKGASLTKQGNPKGTSGTALTLGSNATATSPPICAHLDYSVSRMFAITTAGADATLKVEVIYKDAVTGKQGIKTTILPAQSAWGPTPMWDMPFLSQINLDPTSPAALGGGVPVQFRFTASNKSTWKLDDVWVDPRCRT